MCSILSLQISDLPSLWRSLRPLWRTSSQGWASFVWVLDSTPQFFGQAPNTLHTITTLMLQQTSFCCTTIRVVSTSIRWLLV